MVLTWKRSWYNYECCFHQLMSELQFVPNEILWIVAVVYDTNSWIVFALIFRQLDSVGRSVFKENVRLNEVVAYHLKETEELQKIKQKLEEDNSFLLLEKVLIMIISPFFIFLWRYLETIFVKVHWDYYLCAKISVKNATIWKYFGKLRLLLKSDGN